MLKRYDIEADDWGGPSWREVEDKDGEWVKWEDIKHLIPVDEDFSRTQGVPD